MYYAFDIRFVNDKDTRNVILLARKETLERICARNTEGRLRFSEYVIGEGERLFLQLEKLHLEGMVAKRADSLYVGGRSRDWLKIKTDAGRQEMLKRSEAWGL
jgi:bifunctional non-homologous end joining protein LigD